MTIHTTLKLIKEWHYKKLDRYNKRFVDNTLDGLSGLGDVEDSQVGDYMSPNQVAHAKKLGRRFRIK